PAPPSVPRTWDPPSTPGPPPGRAVPGGPQEETRSASRPNTGRRESGGRAAPADSVQPQLTGDAVDCPVEADTQGVGALPGRGGDPPPRPARGPLVREAPLLLGQSAAEPLQQVPVGDHLAGAGAGIDESPLVGAVAGAAAAAAGRLLFPGLVGDLVA